MPRKIRDILKDYYDAGFYVVKGAGKVTTASFDTKNTPVVSFLTEKMVMIVVNTKSET